MAFCNSLSHSFGNACIFLSYFASGTGGKAEILDPRVEISVFLSWFVLLFRGALQLVGPQLVLMLGIILAQVQDSHFPLNFMLFPSAVCPVCISFAICFA